MKTLNNLKKYLVLMTLAFFIASCEESELNEKTSISQDEQEEGFKSQTENSDSEIEELSDEKALFHMRYSGDISEEEANTKFDVDVKSFMEEYKKNNRGVSTEWFYFISTHTGIQTDNNTDASVWARALFKTDKGGINAGWKELNNYGNDREKGDIDFYLFRTYYPGQAVSWVEVDYASIALKGTDGWFVTRFNVILRDDEQSVSASGKSEIITYPLVWLDNTSSGGWDYYHNGNDAGRLNF